MTAEQIARLTPTLARVIVHLRPGKQETASGLILPPSAQQITQYGDVLAVGPDQHTICPGDLVLINMHCGISLGNHLNTPVLLVNPEDVQAIINP